MEPSTPASFDNSLLPPAYAAQMTRLLGDQEAAAYFRSLGEAPRSGLRVNTLKLSPGEFRGLSPWPLEPVAWCEEGFRLPDEAPAGKHAKNSIVHGVAGPHGRNCRLALRWSLGR